MNEAPQLLPFQPLLDELAARGFYFGVDTWLRLLRLVAIKADRSPEDALSDWKYSLAALLCQSEEQQQVFYEVFKKHYEKEEPADDSPVTPPPSPKPTTEESQTDAAEKVVPLPGGGTEKPVIQQVNSSRKGPIRLQLTFPPDPMRVWNLTGMDAAMQPLREKEWTETFDWDIPASIHQTIRSGGIPQFVFQRRKKAPAYVVLIEQQSPKDHLAAFFEEMVREMNRRDLDAEVYFYQGLPDFCWKSRQDMRARIPIERIRAERPDARLLLVGEAAPLLEFPKLYPSNLAISLREVWGQVALLSTKPTANWNEQELSVCQLFPVVPANASGLGSLLWQWNTGHSFLPAHWRLASPEPPLPELKWRGKEVPKEIITSLLRYLGPGGFRWLCAAAFYPELHYALTALFNNESIPEEADLSEWEQNALWWVALGRLCRLPWFRQGRLPNALREALRPRLQEPYAAEVRRQLLEVLNLPGNQPKESGTYAAASHAFTYAWLSAEQSGSPIASFLPSDITINISDIEDAIGRKIWRQQTAPPPLDLDPNRFNILWVNDHFNRFNNLTDRWNELMGTISWHADSVEKTLQMLGSQGFSLVIATMELGDDREAGLRLYREITASGLPVRLAFFTPEGTAFWKERLPLHPDFYENTKDLQRLVSDMVQERQRQQMAQTAGSVPPEAEQAPESEPPLQESYEAPPTESMASLDAEISNIQSAIAADESKRALELLEALDAKWETGLTNQIILQKGQLKGLQKDIAKGVISNEDAARTQARIRYALLEILKDIPRKAELQQKLKSTPPPPEDERLSDLKRQLKTLAISDLNAAIIRLQGELHQQNPSYSTLLILKSRYENINKNVRAGLYDFNRQQQEEAKVLEGFLQLIDTLEITHLTVPLPRVGKLLYRIPRAWQLQKEEMIIVRIAFDEKILLRGYSMTEDTTIQEISVSEIMGVELFSNESESPFKVRSIKQVEQFLVKEDFVEWRFYAKPEFDGEFSLQLKVSVIEMIDGKERKRDVIIEQPVNVSFDEGKAESQSDFFKAGDFSYQSNVPPKKAAPKKRK